MSQKIKTAIKILGCILLILLCFKTAIDIFKDDSSGKETQNEILLQSIQRQMEQQLAKENRLYDLLEKSENKSSELEKQLLKSRSSWPQASKEAKEKLDVTSIITLDQIHNETVDDCDKLIASKDSTIGIQAAIITNKDSTISLKDSSHAIIVDGLKSDLKKEKRKAIATKLKSFGIATAAVITSAVIVIVTISKE